MHSLYTPSLTNKKVRRTKSFSIHNLVIVAFIGGLLAITIVGFINANALKLEKHYIRLLIVSSVILHTATIIFYVFLPFSAEMDLLINRLLAGVSYFIFLVILKRPYKEHLVFVGETKSLYWIGIIYCLISIFIDGFLRNSVLAN
ncbi:hypothetical protein AB9L15_09395 [Lysinibacillus fusiformis]|uniref:hypothetical protein n=1 Tax=Lysinibacillus TaxID=400634 RepID=UPI0000F37824|nr:hypothetical protein [Lysinibacillus fusiformis]EAZ85457.1 hypothetical protein BB14905_14710 [Bacillus sp. B14905]MED4079159.1 hypothetical protein [Lysinibacillus fusiformis]PCD84955.1 hypothetical protein CNQ87_11585 [Lysinibacillus fusiformis]